MKAIQIGSEEFQDLIRAARRNKAVKAIYELAGLEQGWDFGEGDPITQEAIDKAISMIDPDFDIEAFPSTDGAISLTYFHKDFTTFNTSLDVICLPNNKFEIEFQEGIGLNYASWEPKGNEITENQLHRYLRIYNQHPRSQDFLQHVGIFSDHIWECVYDSRVYILVERCNKEGS